MSPFISFMSRFIFTFLYCLLVKVHAMASKRAVTDIFTWEVVIKLNRRRKSLREIGKIINRPHCTVWKVVNNYLWNVTMCNRVERGRKRITTVMDEEYLISQIMVNPRISVLELWIDVSSRIEKTVSTETVCRIYN